MRSTTYSETQKMDTIWPLALMALTLVFNWFIYFRQGHEDLDFLYASTGTVGLVCLLFLVLRLKLEIDGKSIQYRFYPFHFSWQTINWSDVASAEVRKYKPLSEFGGWGLRVGFKGKAYTVSGNKGLQLHLKNGKKVLFGTGRPDALASFLKEAGIDATISL